MVTSNTNSKIYKSRNKEKKLILDINKIYVELIKA